MGGSINIIVNNLIGFTTIPRDEHSSRFSSDLGKSLPIPIFHVNSQDPDAVVRVGGLRSSTDIRSASPVIMDLIGYRKHGHSEVDDPTITQPLRYRKDRSTSADVSDYAEKIDADPQPIIQRVHEELDAAQKRAIELEKNPPMRDSAGVLESLSRR